MITHDSISVTAATIGNEDREMTKAALNRQEAIGMISFLYLPEQNDYDLRLPDNGAAGIAENIEKLAPLGRTARWQAAIDRWANMVREHSGNDRSLRWAFLQGMIFAGHASE